MKTLLPKCIAIYSRGIDSSVATVHEPLCAYCFFNSLVVNKISVHYKLHLVSEAAVAMVIVNFVGDRITYNVVCFPFFALLLLVLPTEWIGPKRTEDKCRNQQHGSSLWLKDHVDKNLFVIIQFHLAINLSVALVTCFMTFSALFVCVRKQEVEYKLIYYR